MECKRVLEANGTLPNFGDADGGGSPGMGAMPKLEPDMWTGVTV